MLRIQFINEGQQINFEVNPSKYNAPIKRLKKIMKYDKNYG